jgi:hypothetical protein
MAALKVSTSSNDRAGPSRAIRIKYQPKCVDVASRDGKKREGLKGRLLATRSFEETFETRSSPRDAAEADLARPTVGRSGPKSSVDRGVLNARAARVSPLERCRRPGYGGGL